MNPESRRLNMARAYPGSDTLSGVARPHREMDKRANIMKFATLNVGSLPSRSRELADLLKRRKINIACVQETKWIGEKSKEIEEGYKLVYYGVCKKNGVGIIFDENCKKNIVEVNRISDRMMAVKVLINEEIVNIISAYAPQVGCKNEEKDEFWNIFDRTMENIPENEKLWIGADLNGHIGKDNSGFERAHEGHVFGVRNVEGERILESAEAADLVIANSCFSKRDEHLITYKSGGNNSQIDFVMTRKAERKHLKNCRVIPGEAITTQHRLVVCDIELRTKKVKKARKKDPNIRIWKLKGASKRLYCVRVSRRREQLKENERTTVDEKWNNMKEIMLEEARNVCGLTRPGKIRKDIETWWWNDGVQRRIKAKKEAFKKWQASRTEQDRVFYKEMRKEQ